MGWGGGDIDGLGGKQSTGSVQQCYRGETAKGDSTCLVNGNQT